MIENIDLTEARIPKWKESESVDYCSGYKYQTKKNFRIFIPELAGREPYNSQFIRLEAGWLFIKAGYAWDGPSGPTWPTKSSMRGSLVHDALYQLIRCGHLSICDGDRDLADQIFHNLLVKDKMWKWRARLWYNAVQRFAEKAASGPPKKVRTAP